MMEYTFSRFFQMAEKHPDRVALIYLGTRFRYAMLRDAVERFATALHELGVGKGGRVLLYLSNSPQWVIANFAVQRLGAAVVPVSPIYTAHEIEYMVGDAAVETILCLDTNFGYVHEILPRTAVKRVVVTSLVDLLPAWKRVAGRLMDRVPSGRTVRGGHVYSFARLLRSTEAAVPAVDIDPRRDLASIMYTGGTTAFPKGVPGTHMTEISYVRDVMEDVISGHIGEGDDRILMMAPLFHIMPKGFFIATGLNFGNATVLMPIPHIDAMLGAIERYRVRWLLGVPSMYRMALECDRIGHYRLDSLRYCFCGGDVLPAEIFQRWREATGASIRQVYGSTEVGHVTYGSLDAEPRPGSIGRPLKSFRCRVVDPATLAEVPAGEVGELLVTSEFIGREYLNKPEETARCYVEIDGAPHYRMGDLVIREPDGEIRFVERTADIIKHKGYRVSASEIEAVLQDHPMVIGACVVGVEDPAVGQRIKAIAVLNDDAQGVTGPELRAWCRERLAPHKVPCHIEFRDMLPKSKVGKLLRREIRGEEQRKARGDAGPRDESA
ncbi:MAG: AMP-binding protein [Planctomycetota bacterium]